MKTQSEESKKDYLRKKQALIELSKAARILREKSETPDLPLNHFIMQLYQADKPGTYKTFQEWKAVGKSVKKGEKGIAIWGVPLQTTKKKTADDGTTTEQELEFFPLCYLFHEGQVEERTKKMAEV